MYVAPIDIIVALAGLLAPLILIGACVLYIARTKSLLAIGLLIGAAGILLMAIVNPVFTLWLNRTLMYEGMWEISRALYYLIIAGTIFAELLFAACLFFVLRRATKTTGVAKTASAAPPAPAGAPQFPPPTTPPSGPASSAAGPSVMPTEPPGDIPRNTQPDTQQ